MRVLLIAPHNDTLTQSAMEAASITRYHDTEMVSGTVRPVDIEMAVGKGPYDVIWFVTHQTSEGILLTDTVLSTSVASGYISASRAGLCVLNTCASEQFATLIIAGGEADMIATISPDIGDVDAAQFGSLLAKELAETDDFEEAFRKATGPATGKYRYLDAKQATRGVISGLPTALDKLQDKVDRLAETQYRLTVDLDMLTTRFGEMTAQGLINQQRTMQAQSASNQAQPVANISPTLIALVVLIIVVVAGVAFLSGRSF